MSVVEKYFDLMLYTANCLINKRNTKSYDEAVKIIKDLNQLAKHKNKQDDFT